MIGRTLIPIALFCIACQVRANDLAALAQIQLILKEQCLDCHNAQTREGSLDLERFDSHEHVMRDRATWKRIYDVVEGGQMPLPQSGYELTAAQRDQVLRYVEAIQALPDLDLHAMDPGKPVLRRLTRLEYNNTVRDLFGLTYDIFMFPERLPVSDKRYFTDHQGAPSLGTTIETSMREYGQKYDVLLPSQGLPGDTRAEYGFTNRGDTQNLSPLLLEKYLEVAAAIAHSTRLRQESPVLQKLLGLDPASFARPTENNKPAEDTSAADAIVRASANYPDRSRLGGQAKDNDTWHDSFVTELTSAFERGSGGVFEIPASMNNRKVAGKGGIIKMRVGGRTLTINPNVDLWLAAFATADETSGDHLLTNQVKGEKQFELTFGLDEGGDPEIQHLAVCVLARRNQPGTVTLTAILDNGQRIPRSAEITTDQGNIFFSWVAPPQRTIKRLSVDGSAFSGDYVLLDDFGFILADAPIAPSNQELPNEPEPAPPPQVITPDRSRSAKEPPLPLDQRVAAFLTRAYRRPLRENELRDALAIVQSARIPAQVTSSTDSSGLNAEQQGLIQLVQTILASPEFLFLAEAIEPTAPKVRPLSATELANRLGYFLWSTMPDTELQTLAASGKLAELEVLRAQAARLLKHRSHSRELSESFAVQWLRLDQLYTSKPDRQRYSQFYAGPQGKATLHGSMMTEALLLFETVFAEDRSILDFYDADYTWLNASLAKLYSLEAAYDAAIEAARTAGTLPRHIPEKSLGKIWLRVPLPDRNRGGYLTMGGPLVLTSLPQRTSPVKRGAWLLETVFNRPPPEPKVAFVLEEVSKAKEDLKSARTVREIFDAHRQDANCYSCHIRIDPPGFALEMYDAIGGWRTHEGDAVIDASGRWNDTSFASPAQFKEAIRVKQQELVRGFVEHLLSYAIGRRVEHFDLPAVNQIVARAAADDYRFSSVVTAIVESYPFRNVRNVP